MLALGDPDGAGDLARSALAVSCGRDAPWLAPEAHHLLGNVAGARGDAEGALREYELAVTGIEQLQSALAIELRGNFLEDKLRVYEDAIAVSLHLARPRLAFAYLERAKSRALVDYLAGNPAIRIRTRPGANRELVDQLARLREEHHWFYNRLYDYGPARRAGAADGDGPNPAEEERLRATVRDRERRIARLLERLALDRAAEVGPVASAHAGAHLLPERLDPSTVLLEYHFRLDGSAVFVLSGAGLTAVPLDARPGDIRRLLGQWRLNLATAARAIAAGTPLDGLGRNARGILAALHRALIAPVAAHLTGCERLIVVPYGPTHAVPFHALYDADSGRYLLEAVEVTACPSSSLLRLCTERPKRTGPDAAPSALVLAHTDSGRLPFVLEEARAVAALLPGESYVEHEATRDALAAAASRHAVLHLAAHGEARLDNPTFAHLKLADGQLGTVDVFNLDLDGALVVLSACETGRSVVTGGDELIGLSRGFLHAGAATLVQSLWRVEDGSTARLMADFYRALRAGRSKGAALREAQLALLAAGEAHPYYWAPFQLIGDNGGL